MKNRKGASPGSSVPASKFRFYGDQFVLDTISGKFYRVTPTAGFILRAIIDGKSRAEIVNVVQQHFGIDRARALRDLEMFESELQSLEIFENLSQ
jgi:hypothetical protein